MWNFFKKKDVAVLVSEGHAFLQADDRAQAEARFQEVTRIDPAHAEAWYCLGTILGDTGRFDEAVECYRQSVQHAPAERKALPLYNMGNVLKAMGQADQAIAVYRLTITADPGFADAWINLGCLVDDGGNHAEALDCYGKALAVAPDDSTALSNQGNSLRSLRRFDEARASYEACLAIDPADPASLSGLGFCLAEQGQPEQGLELVDRALELVSFPPWLVERATILSQLDRNDEALETVDHAIDQGVQGVEVFNNRGEILAKLGKTEEALASFDRALSLDSKYVSSLFGKARVLCNSGQFGPAKATIDRYFELSDGSDGLGEAAEALVDLCRNAGVE